MYSCTVRVDAGLDHGHGSDLDDLKETKDQAETSTSPSESRAVKQEAQGRCPVSDLP